MRESTGQLVLIAVVSQGDDARDAVDEPHKQSGDRTIYAVSVFNREFLHHDHDEISLIFNKRAGVGMRHRERATDGIVIAVDLDQSFSIVRTLNWAK